MRVGLPQNLEATARTPLLHRSLPYVTLSAAKRNKNKSAEFKDFKPPKEKKNLAGFTYIGPEHGEDHHTQLVVHSMVSNMARTADVCAVKQKADKHSTLNRLR